MERGRICRRRQAAHRRQHGHDLRHRCRVLAPRAQRHRRQERRHGRPVRDRRQPVLGQHRPDCGGARRRTQGAWLCSRTLSRRRRLLRHGAAPARRERDLAHLESLGRLAARLRQLHLLYREHPLGWRDCPCRAHPELPLPSPRRVHVVFDQGRGHFLRPGGSPG